MKSTRFGLALEAADRVIERAPYEWKSRAGEAPFFRGLPRDQCRIRDVRRHGGGEAQSRTAKQMRAEERRRGAVQVEVRGSIDQALLVLKRKLSKEGVFAQLRRRELCIKPSEKRRQKQDRAETRRRRTIRRVVQL